MAKKIKTLANCTPTEFLTQTYRISEQLEQFYNDLGIVSILSKEPVYDDNDTDEQKKQKKREQDKKNLKAFLNKLFVECPKQTIDFFALCCFLNPEDVTKENMSDVISNGIDAIMNEQVTDFFILSKKLGG